MTKPILLTARVKRGLALLAAARAWIAYGVEHCRWLVKRKRRPSWREAVANPGLADKRGFS